MGQGVEWALSSPVASAAAAGCLLAGVGSHGFAQVRDAARRAVAHTLPAAHAAAAAGMPWGRHVA
eukprot:6389334-Alexandrium_andersonii.AAC.1